jgi:hypothetical protein
MHYTNAKFSGILCTNLSWNVTNSLVYCVQIYLEMPQILWYSAYKFTLECHKFSGILCTNLLWNAINSLVYYFGLLIIQWVLHCIAEDLPNSQVNFCTTHSKIKLPHCIAEFPIFPCKFLHSHIPRLNFHTV